ncbi:hypothetical protein NQ317_018052 [Molorchus minor]|uniref:Protein Wnt n=1 Tax=Molorchus minor TaxID=1323400 RepID=A0ABQ9JD78_9CUCU|nr:hypothetical protein NQ317_018052 [Molorchus minor]
MYVYLLNTRLERIFKWEDVDFCGVPNFLLNPPEDTHTASAPHCILKTAAPDPANAWIVYGVTFEAAFCSVIPGLTSRQREMCRMSPDAMVAVGDGIRLATNECRYQFRHHRWNCTGIENPSSFGHVVIVDEERWTVCVEDMYGAKQMNPSRQEKTKKCKRKNPEATLPIESENGPFFLAPSQKREQEVVLNAEENTEDELENYENECAGCKEGYRVTKRRLD